MCVNEIFSSRSILILPHLSDGTLITQRLHWAPSPYRYRHVLGWYRLVTELKESDVNAICVFDGIERCAAKTSEVRYKLLVNQ